MDFNNDLKQEAFLFCDLINLKWVNLPGMCHYSVINLALKALFQ